MTEENRSHGETASGLEGTPDDIGRREMLAYAAAFGTSFLAAQGLVRGDDETEEEAGDSAPAGKRYDMKTSMNLWALPYPDRMSLEECFEVCADAGFDGVEVNYALEGDISPEASGKDLERIGRRASDLGLSISSVCSGLFWPYGFSHPDAERREKGKELTKKMIDAAARLGTDNLLVVPGAVGLPWSSDHPPVPNDVALDRAREGVGEVLPTAEDAGVYINLENIVSNGILMEPRAMARFADEFDSDHLRIHFDTGNVMQYQFPEHWIPILGDRIRNVHFKEYSKKVHTFGPNDYRLLLDGTTDWPAVLKALDGIGYRGYVTLEYFNPFPHWPEALARYTADAMNRMLGKR